MNGPAPIHERIDSERTDLLEAEARLRSVVRTLGSTAVAFSGGVDSSLVLKVCVDELKERAIAVIGVSPSLPPGGKPRRRSSISSTPARPPLTWRARRQRRSWRIA